LYIWLAALPMIKKPFISLKKAFCFGILFLTSIYCSGQEAIDYKVHANIIYRFTKYIEWPETEESNSFVIGVLGDSPLNDELRDLTANKLVGHRKIVVRKFNTPASFTGCSILFISEEESTELKRITEMTRDKPVLLITESAGLAKKGSCINIVILNERLKLEINKNNITSRNMNIASELLKLATIVE
jgi:hypothetical protein